MSKDRSARSVLARVFASSLLARQAYAGNEANFVLYDHHTDDKGETEVNVFGDFSNRSAMSQAIPRNCSRSNAP
jgi:hypothetical protein